MLKSVETVIIGAGLAGLACAVTLQKNNREFLIIEKADRPGGRVKTDRIKGFQFDHGFQVLNPGYQQVKNLINLSDLNLNYFDAGFTIKDGNRFRTIRDPLRHPTKLISTLKNLPGTYSQKAKFIKYVVKLLSTNQGARFKFTDLTTKAALVEAGIDEEFLMKVLAPFLKGVFLESRLDTSRIFLDEVLVSFFRGTPALPEHGMGAMPEQLALKIKPENIRFNELVTGIKPGLVTTANSTYKTSNIIIATDVQVATNLLNLPEPKVHKVKTWYLIADQQKGEFLNGEKLLLTEANPSAPLVNSVLISNIAPSYAPPKTALISASAIEEKIKLEQKDLLIYLEKLYQLPTKNWQIVAEYQIANALPAMYPPFTPIRNARLSEGLFVAGDHRNFSSIQGALASGVQAAHALINKSN